MAIESSTVEGDKLTVRIPVSFCSLEMGSGLLVLHADKESPENWKLEVWQYDGNLAPPSVFNLPVTRDEEFITCWNNKDFVLYEMGKSLVIGEPSRNRETYVPRDSFLHAIGMALKFVQA